LKGVLEGLTMYFASYTHNFISCISSFQILINNVDLDGEFNQVMQTTDINLLKLSKKSSNEGVSIAESFPMVFKELITITGEDLEPYKKMDPVESEGEKLTDSPVKEGQNVNPDAEMDVTEAAKRFGLDPDEQILDSFACALSKRILLQGRLYVTPRKVCFHSYFNDSTIFGKNSTIIIVPMSDIIRVDKKTTAFLFNNGLKIVTKDIEFVFASFMNREVVATLIENAMGIAEISKSTKEDVTSPIQSEKRPNNFFESPEKVKTEAPKNNQPRPSILERHFSTPIREMIQNQTDQPQAEHQNRSAMRKMLRTKRKKSDKKGSTGSGSGAKLSKEDFSTVEEYFNAIEESRLQKLGDEVTLDDYEGVLDPLKTAGVKSHQVFTQIFNDNAKFLEEYAKMKGDTEMEITQWDPVPPDFFVKDFKLITGGDDDEDDGETKTDGLTAEKQLEELGELAQDWPLKSTRQVKYVHPVWDKNPFCKTVKTSEEQTVYWISPNRFVLMTLISVTGAPATDCFKVSQKFVVTQNVPISGQDLSTLETTLSFSYNINWLKGTMLKSRIESSNKKETKETFDSYFVEVAKQELSGVAGGDGAVSKADLDALKKELMASNRQVKKLKSDLEEANNNSQLMTKIFGGVCLVLFLYSYIISSRLTSLANRFDE